MPTQTRAPVAVALDAPDVETAARWAQAVTPYVAVVKVGLELFCRTGPSVVESVRGGSGVGLFLDLKLHDIPNTVHGAARAAGALGARLLTVHAAGGAEMIARAVEGAGPACGVLAVTVLTSLDDAALALAAGAAVTRVSEEVRRLAALAGRAGAHGVVCSGHEAALVRAEHGDGLRVLVPGVRPAGAGAHDQRRTVTPAQAAASGASYVVLGRAVTRSPDPAAALRALVRAMESVEPGA